MAVDDGRGMVDMLRTALEGAGYQVVKVPYRFVPDDRWLPVYRFLDKPVDPKKLLARIRELLPGEG